MFGAWDGMYIAELPDGDAAAAVSLKISISEDFSRVQIHQLKTADELAAALNTRQGSRLLTARHVTEPTEPEALPSAGKTLAPKSTRAHSVRGTTGRPG
jgi:hypothetical protein